MIFDRSCVIKRKLNRWLLLRAVAWDSKNCCKSFSILNQIHVCWRIKRLKSNKRCFENSISCFKEFSERFWLHAERKDALKRVSSCHWQLTARNVVSKVLIRSCTRLISLSYTFLLIFKIWAACKWCTIVVNSLFNSFSFLLW